MTTVTTQTTLTTNNQVIELENFHINQNSEELYVSFRWCYTISPNEISGRITIKEGEYCSFDAFVNVIDVRVDTSSMYVRLKLMPLEGLSDKIFIKESELDWKEYGF